MFLCNVKPSAAVAIFVSVAYLLQLSTQFRPGWIVMEREEELVNMTRSPLPSLEIILNSGLRGKCKYFYPSFHHSRATASRVTWKPFLHCVHTVHNTTLYLHTKQRQTILMFYPSSEVASARLPSATGHWAPAVSPDRLASGAENFANTNTRIIFIS